jgi:pimeloyl-ACP methyl ester carboxylesterase
MHTSTFQYKDASLHYGVYPGGPKILLAFHGFGQSQTYFSSLAKVLESEFTLYSFDLFYHGQSQWSDSHQPLTKEFWAQMMEAFLADHQIERFSLAGFSLGGKFVLATFEAFPERTSDILLIAPDGIHSSFWYNLATYPAWARKYFRGVVDQPENLFKLFELVNRFQLLDPGVIRFASYQMQVRHQRERVYNTWVMSRQLRFNMRHIGRLINKHHVHIKMFVGRYDKIMTERNMQRLLRHLRTYDLQVLETGHSMMIDKVARHLQQQP